MKFNKVVLKNGLTVLHEKRDVPVTTVMLATRFGSVYESEKEKGIAHFIEHLCFKGTKKRTTNQIASELEKVGGNLNAFTSEEETAYHVKLPSRYLELAMDVISDIFFNPVFPEEEIKKEANVICEEIKMYKDNPRGHVMTEIKACLYKDAFGMSIAGIEKNVLSMNREQLLNKHQEFYCPANSILCVVGNNYFEDVVKLAEKYCVSQNINTKKHVLEKIEFQNIKKTEKRESLQQASIIIGMHFPKMNDGDRYASEVFAAILGEGMSSKLFTEVREKRGLAYAVKTELDMGKEYSYIIIYIGTDKEKTKPVIDLCIQEFKKMSEISEKELMQGKEQIIGNSDVESESSDSTTLNLILEEIADKAENHYKYEENINKVNLDDIKRLAKVSDFSYFILTP
ncbi:MAG: pitrilysin family protein [Nanoarchaeota archaeon]|nr:pitrilysin family protein [Nanoarchaeota archaeon]